METLKFLGTTNLKWKRNTLSIDKRAQQRNVLPKLAEEIQPAADLMIQFYTAIITSTLTSFIMVWFGSATLREQAKLQHIISTVERITGCSLAALQEIYNSRVTKRASKITADPLFLISPLPATSLW